MRANRCTQCSSRRKGHISPEALQKNAGEQAAWAGYPSGPDITLASNTSCAKPLHDGRPPSVKCVFKANPDAQEFGSLLGAAPSLATPLTSELRIELALGAKDRIIILSYLLLAS